jgi:hypothetical protein
MIGPQNAGETNHGAQPTAIHELYFREVQNEPLRLERMFLNFLLKRLDLGTSDDATLAPD